MRNRIVYAAAAALTPLAVAGCDDDRGARQDLPNAQQVLDDEEVANVIRMPDKFPGMVWQCFGPDETTGYYAVTDRWVWVVYNDPNCGGRGQIIVVDNVPGADLVADGASG